MEKSLFLLLQQILKMFWPISRIMVQKVSILQRQVSAFIQPFQTIQEMQFP